VAIAPPGERGRALQVVSMGQSLAVLLGVPAGAYIATNFSWRLDYFAIAAAAFAASLALYVKLPRGMPGDEQSLLDRMRVLGNRGVVPALLTTLLCMMAAYFPIIFIGPVMSAAGLSHDLLPFPLLANGVGAVLASLTAGRIADRIGNKRAVVLSCAVLIGALAVFVPLPNLPEAIRPPVLFATYGLLGYIGWGYWISHCSEMAHLAPTSVPVAISLNLTALNVGVAIAAAVGGAMVDGWGANALGLVSVPIAVAALVLALVTPERAETAA
jgi:predicted MFS family arabinose efflux permease